MLAGTAETPDPTTQVIYKRVHEESLGGWLTTFDVQK